ncbi:TIGR02301 family protein [Azorhizobium sp. AG788]|uniref:TIGR02301 family protein n=1 Tax=Azorhizobium sp. AG788 TaxID=2183897 RepID=UPI00313A483A
MVRPPKLLIAVLLACALGARGAAAAPAEGSTPPYEGDLMKIAELLGALHYLRPLCGAAGEAQRWRTEMQTLMDAEQPSDARKGKLVAAFNAGYSSYATVYRTCTPAAAMAVQRQMEEGAKLSHDIVVRFGGN